MDESDMSEWMNEWLNEKGDEWPNNWQLAAFKWMDWQQNEQLDNHINYENLHCTKKSISSKLRIFKNSHPV